MIICAGHAAFDLAFSLEDFPKENSKYMLEESGESSGGPATNAASLLGRWGVSVALLAPLGNDLFGIKIRADLETDGVLTELLRIEEIPTPLSVIMTNTATGSRTILTRRPKRPSLTLDPVLLDRTSTEFDVEGLVFDGHEPEVSLALMERYPRAWSLLDAGTLRPGTELLARKVDYLIASASFTLTLAEREGLAVVEADAETMRSIASRGIAALRRLSSGWVCFTRGERGCVRQESPEGPILTMPALAGKVADTTAAGDIFHGAFAYGLLTEGTPDRALLWATAAAGLSVRRRGGRASIPTLEETRAIIERGLVSIGND